VAANVDVLCNVAGAACGAALAVLAAPAVLGGPLERLRSAAFLDGADIDFGLALLALWLFTQLNPATLLFAAGDLRDWLTPGIGRARAPQFFVGIEAFIAAANVVSVSLLLSALARPGQPVRTMFLALVLAAVGVKTAAVAILMHAENVLVWLTPGAQFGLATGILVALAALALPRVARLAAAAVLLMAATVLVNLAPPNPYLAASLKLWQQGHFLNFNGVTRLVSALWAYVALGGASRSAKIAYVPLRKTRLFLLQPARRWARVLQRQGRKRTARLRQAPRERAGPRRAGQDPHQPSRLPRSLRGRPVRRRLSGGGLVYVRRPC